MQAMTMHYEVILLVLLVILLLGGTTIYLAVNMMRGLRADDELLAQMNRNLQYLLVEQGSLARSVRHALTTHQAAGSEGEDSFDFSGLDQMQSEGLGELSLVSHDTHGLLAEMANLEGRNLTAWKEANQARIQSLLAQQTSLHRKLAESQEMLGEAQKSIRTLKNDHTRLAAAELRLRSLEQIHASQGAELATAKNKLGVMQVESTRVREAMTEQENRFKSLHEQYMKERNAMAREKAALEDRLAALQASFDSRLQQATNEEELQRLREQYQSERAALEQDKIQLENKLQELQESFDRTLREKTFIETAFLDLDTSLIENRLAGTPESRE